MTNTHSSWLELRPLPTFQVGNDKSARKKDVNFLNNNAKIIDAVTLTKATLPGQ